MSRDEPNPRMALPRPTASDSLPKPAAPLPEQPRLLERWFLLAMDFTWGDLIQSLQRYERHFRPTGAYLARVWFLAWGTTLGSGALLMFCLLQTPTPLVTTRSAAAPAGRTNPETADTGNSEDQPWLPATATEFKTSSSPAVNLQNAFYEYEEEAAPPAEHTAPHTPASQQLTAPPIPSP